MFEYRAIIRNIKVLVEKDGISYGFGNKMKKIDKADMLGIGIAFDMRHMTVYSREKMARELTENPSTEANNLPKGAGWLTISYGPSVEKQKLERIIFNTHDQNAVAMLSEVQEKFKDEYVGAGTLLQTMDRLKVKDRTALAIGVALLMVAIIIVVVVVVAASGN